MNNSDIIVKPVLSEKSTDLAAEKKYVFRVARSANKTMIKNAVKEIFNVTPLKVNVMKVRGRRKRVRYQYGFTASWKKAIVTLGGTDKIELFENQ